MGETISTTTSAERGLVLRDCIVCGGTYKGEEGGEV